MMSSKAWFFYNYKKIYITFFFIVDSAEEVLEYLENNKKVKTMEITSPDPVITSMVTDCKWWILNHSVYWVN
jgi:hypothetical protein